MRRSPRVIPPALWVTAAVTTLLSLVLAVPAPASADSVTPVVECPPGDRSYSSVGSDSATVTAPEGYRIASFCVVGRGNAGPERHTLSTPQRTTVVSHSSGKQLVSYSVTYVQIPVVSEPEPVEETAKAKAEPKAERTADTQRATVAPRASATTEKSQVPEEVSPLGALTHDGEELRITTFEDEDKSEDRRSFLVVGGVIVLGLVAGAIALTVRLPGQR